MGSKNGYLFEFDPKGDDTPTEPNQPMANISWTDCIAWCNAYTEMMFGNTEECVYRAGSVSGAVIKHAFHGDKAYCDFSKKVTVYRLKQNGSTPPVIKVLTIPMRKATALSI